jgi:hypothetical protein
MRLDYYFEFEDFLYNSFIITSDRGVIKADELITSSFILIRN